MGRWSRDTARGNKLLLVASCLLCILESKHGLSLTCLSGSIPYFVTEIPRIMIIRLATKQTDKMLLGKVMSLGDPFILIISQVRR